VTNVFSQETSVLHASHPVACEDYMGLPRRTNRTGLSDPELLILDFLFDKGGASFGMLASDEYSYAFHMNCDYDHGLTDDQLARDF